MRKNVIETKEYNGSGDHENKKPSLQKGNGLLSEKRTPLIRHT